MNDDRTVRPPAALDRRALFKLGVGVGTGIVMGETLSGRECQRTARRRCGGPSTTSPAYRPERWREELRYSGVKMQSGSGLQARPPQRAAGNGAMDRDQPQDRRYARSFSAPPISRRALEGAFANTMLDSIASLVSGFESEPARICARLARTTARRPRKHRARLRHRHDTRARGLRQQQHDPPHRFQRSHERHDRRRSSQWARRHMPPAPTYAGDRPGLPGVRRAQQRRRQHRRLRRGHLLRARRGRRRRQAARPERGSARQRAVARTDDARAAAREPQRHAIDAEGLRDCGRGAQRRVRGAGRA